MSRTRSPYFVLLLSSCLLSVSLPANAITPHSTHATAELTKVNMSHSPELHTRLQQSLTAKGAKYRPRTKHLNQDGSPIYLNRLMLEDSPYLIQHAHNPVDWYSWGDEAFATAKRENKPIFLSIGYSTCHWCHVMEEQSFDNPEVAKLLNQFFISIKVDREQRPDIDAAYMSAVMMINQRGGWPMSSFLTPEGKTFYAGTYYPKQQFTHLLTQISQGWDQKNAQFLAEAERIAIGVADANRTKARGGQITEAISHQAVQINLTNFDANFGGFSLAPKFPNEPSLLFLLDQNRRHTNPDLTKALRKTLNAMAQGGIYDQVGGGFSRYSTDIYWLIPHFEKMLYNQALLARTYTHSWLQTGEQMDQRVVQQILDYVLRDMRSPLQGFYSATDADSEGEEGLFFLWTIEQINALLTPEDASFAIKIFGMSAKGNFEGQNILNLPLSPSEFAQQQKLTVSTVYQHLDAIRETLRLAREKRSHPLRDNKIVTAWNGMMITALAEAGSALQQPNYIEAASLAAEFIWQTHRQQDNRLWRTSLKNHASIPASQEDYAYLAEAFITLYNISGQAHWLARAITLTDIMLENFWDAQEGGFFMNEQTQAVPILLRPKDLHDGAIPSGNSVALRVLSLLNQRTPDLKYADFAQKILGTMASIVKRYPASYAYLLMARNELTHGETGAIQFVAKGAVRLSGTLSKKGLVKISLQINPGWHINAHHPLQPDLIATTLTLPKVNLGWSLSDLHYPEATTKTLPFQQHPLALYEKSVMIQAQLISTEKPHHEVVIQIQLQACNHQHCLAPEVIVLQIPTEN